MALHDALPGRGGLVPVLRRAFSFSKVLVKMFGSFHCSRLVRLSPDGTVTLNTEAEQVAGCFLKLDMASGYQPTDVPSNHRVYVRDDCEELYRELLRLHTRKDDVESTLVDLLREDGDKVPIRRGVRMLYLGNPGTGKSLAGLVLLFLLVQKGHSVVYYMHKACHGLYVLFQGGKLVSVMDFAEATQHLVDPSTIYIHDADGSAVIGAGFIKASTLLITSPDEKVYKEFTKVSGGYKKFYGRLWSMEELQVCWRAVYFGTLSWDSVLSQVYYAGRIPRLVFVDADMFESSWDGIKNELYTVDNLVNLFSLIGPHNSSKTFSHKLVHLDRGSQSHLGYTKIASEYVIQQLLLRLDVDHWCTAVVKYKRLQGVSAFADFRGSIMELLMHLTFPKFLTSCERICDGKHHGHDGEHVLNTLPVGEADEMHVLFYSSFDDLEEKIRRCISLKYGSAYLWPRMKTEAAIDSIYVDFVAGVAYLLQSTLAKRHLVVWSPVQKLCNCFKDEGICIAGIYFITSPGNYPRFGWKKVKAVHGNHENLQKMPRLCQYKLKFEMLNDDMENVTKLQDFADSIDANLKAMAGETLDMPEEHLRGRKRTCVETADDTLRPEAWQLSYFDDSFFDADSMFIQDE